MSLDVDVISEISPSQYVKLVGFAFVWVPPGERFTGGLPSSKALFMATGQGHKPSKSQPSRHYAVSPDYVGVTRAHLLQSTTVHLHQFLTSQTPHILALGGQYFCPRLHPRKADPQVSEIAPVAAIALPFSNIPDSAKEGQDHRNPSEGSEIHFVEEIARFCVCVLMQNIELTIRREMEEPAHGLVQSHDARFLCCGEPLLCR